ncbi:hypothetical protein [uncultured Enterococcus sp.]|uniref:hypothetical protein n=1 Tax=uncultured Enterococcus sp. TaxID=167972 RepID=UPI002AA7E636|nr:hypothetical protein [uncultured Enterococcus sp.]
MQKIVFSKYSNERARRFAIRTDIVSDEAKQLTVFKRGLYPEGQQHIENIFKWYQKLSASYSETQIEMNHCELQGDKVALEYLTQFTLEHELNQLLRKRNTEQFTALLFSYINEVRKGEAVHSFVKTEAFIETFGDVEIEEALSAEVTNIDMVLNNVILGEKWTIIDYEWTFDFPIPANFVIYRILHYFINSSPFKSLLDEMELYEQAGISDIEQAVFADMERHFQSSFLLKEKQQDKMIVPIREMHEAISPGSIDLKSIYSEEKQKRETPVQVFMSKEYSFSEEGSLVILCNIEKKVSLTIDLAEETDFLRLDPHEDACYLTDLEIKDESGKKLSIFASNGKQISENQMVFIEHDPQIILSQLKETKRLEISYEIHLISAQEQVVFKDMLMDKQAVDEQVAVLAAQAEEAKQAEQEYQQQLKEKEDRIAYQNQVIANMENTKIWKAYEKYKKTFKKNN